MKISKSKLKETIKYIIKEETQYQIFFKKALKKFGVSSPDEFESEEKKKEFFDYVDKNWKADNESVNEARNFYYNIGRGIYQSTDGSTISNQNKEKKDGYPNAIKVVSSIRQASQLVDKMNKTESVNEEDYDRERDARAMGYRNAKEADKDNWGMPKREGVNEGKAENFEKFINKSITKNPERDKIRDAVMWFSTSVYGSGIPRVPNRSHITIKHVNKVVDKIKKELKNDEEYGQQMMNSFLKKTDIRDASKLIEAKLYSPVMTEEGSEYEEFFKKVLDKFGVSSPDELEGDKKIKFFNYIDKHWDAKDERKESIKQTQVSEAEFKDYVRMIAESQMVNEEKLDVGDTISVDGFVMLKGLDDGNKYKVIKQDGHSYTFQKVGSKKKVRHYKDDVHGAMRPSKSNNKIMKEAGEERAIASQTGTRANAVKKFIDKHNLDGDKLLKWIKKASAGDRMDFVSALVGKPGNKLQRKILKKFGKKLAEKQSFYNATVKFKHGNKEMTGDVVRKDRGKLRIDIGNNKYVVKSPSEVEIVEVVSEADDHGIKYGKEGHVKYITGFNGKKQKEVKVDGKVYRYNPTYKTYNSVKGNELLHKNDVEKAKKLQREEAITERGSMRNDVKKVVDKIKGFSTVEDDGVLVFKNDKYAKDASKELNSSGIAASSDGKYVYLESTLNETKFFVWHKKKKYEVEADSLYKAKKKFIEKHNIPKSQQSKLAIKSAGSMDAGDFRFM